MRERFQRLAPDTPRRELWPHEVDRLTRECQRWRRAVTPADARARFVVDEDDERTRRWLRDVLDLRCAETSIVRLLWPAHRFGIETSWSDFVADHEKLWLRSSDDVWVVPLDLSWLLEMDHEERFSVWVEDD